MLLTIAVVRKGNWCCKWLVTMVHAIFVIFIQIVQYLFSTFALAKRNEEMLGDVICFLL